MAYEIKKNPGEQHHMPQQQERQDVPTPKRLALQLILLLGLVSAFGDITYESARSISGPYLAFLGASAATVGFVSGLGEFIGYALRLASGYLADRTRSYWIATFIGYGLILSIPLLAYTNRWELAVLFLLLERVGKAIRSPSRDTIISHATHQTGRGWGFALHEALDQVGAVIGPLLFTAAFLVRNSYQDGFAVLWLPAILTVVALFVARILVPAPEELEPPKTTDNPKSGKKRGLPRTFWVYALFSFFSVAGFANFQIISYHLTVNSVVPAVQIPILYSVAMAVDALVALIVGKVYDKAGLISLVIIPFLTIPLPFLAFSHSYALAVASVVLWGAIMAIQETTMRAAIADITPVDRRGSAYGIFNTIYGAAWFAGSAVLGLLYEQPRMYLFIFVVAIEVIAFVAFLAVRTANAAQKVSEV